MPSEDGVHLATSKQGAVVWAHQLKHERGPAYDEQVIWRVATPATIPVVDDEMTGLRPAFAVIASTSFGISPRFLTPVGEA